MNEQKLKEVLGVAEEAALLSVCLCEESGNESLKATNTYAQNKKALKLIREYQQQRDEEIAGLMFDLATWKNLAQELVKSGDPKPWKIESWISAKQKVEPNQKP